MDVMVEGGVYMAWAMDDAIFISLVPAAVVSFMTLIIVSLLAQKKYPPKPMRTLDGEDMSKMPKFFWQKS